jgi:hypothetical protein
MSLKHIPVVVRLYPKEVDAADAMKELRVDRHNIDKELLRQPGKYAWWSALYCEAELKSARLHEKLERLESKLFRHYIRKRKRSRRVSDIKHAIMKDSSYLKLRERVLYWDHAARLLKHIVRAFDQRLSGLQTYSANQRKEWKEAEESSGRHHKH